VSDDILTTRGQFEMTSAAAGLTPLSGPVLEGGAELHLITGEAFWYQTSFCAYSLLLQTEVQPRVVIHDDGTLKDERAEFLRQLFPYSTVRRYEETEQRLEEHFPRDKFPLLNARSRDYIVMRKLTAVHGGSTGWKLFLDSDMLFFRPPALLSDWLRAPQQPCHTQEQWRAYGYSKELMASLGGDGIPRSVNSGVSGLLSEEIDWEQVEYWIARLEELEGRRYLMEQALVGLLLAGRSCLALPIKEYVVCPDETEALSPRAVMHHYAGHTRYLLFRHGWRHIAEQARGFTPADYEVGQPGARLARPN
jgi:hypothetical protein